MKTIEDVLRDRVVYIGDEIPEGVANDKRTKCVFLGSPQEIITELEHVVNAMIARRSYE